MSIKTIDPIHHKFIAKFDIIIEFSKYLELALNEFNTEISKDANAVKEKKKDKNIPKFLEYWNVYHEDNMSEEYKKIIADSLSEIYIIRERYNNIAMHFLTDYYAKCTVDIINNYCIFLISENIADKIDSIYQNLENITKQLETETKFRKIFTKKIVTCDPVEIVGGVFDNANEIKMISSNRLSFKDTVAKFKRAYNDNYIDIPSIPNAKSGMCPICNTALTPFADDAEERCLECGYIDQLVGTLYDDSVNFGQTMVAFKNKKHNPNNHCIKWLYQIQAKEVRNFPQYDIDILNHKAIKEYTLEGKVRNMSDMKCWQIRAWLKELKLANYNNHAPLLRKIITGLNGEAIKPPELNAEEEIRILGDFSLAIDIFEIICKREDILRLFNKLAMKNKLYYPFFLLKILIHHFRNDTRLPGFIECIHLQSTTTLTKDDYLWRIICDELGKKGRHYVYEPTDRAILTNITF